MNEQDHEAADTDGIRAIREDDATSAVSGGHAADSALGGTGGGGRTVLSEVSEAGGGPPLPLERMLRVYFLQLWFNLSDPAVEEELYDSVAMRNFAGIYLGVEAAPPLRTKQLCVLGLGY